MSTVTFFTRRPFDILRQDFSWSSAKDLANLLLNTQKKVDKEVWRAAIFELLSRNTTAEIKVTKKLLPRLLEEKELLADPLFRMALFDLLKCADFDEDEKLWIASALFPEILSSQPEHTERSNDTLSSLIPSKPLETFWEILSKESNETGHRLQKNNSDKEDHTFSNVQFLFGPENNYCIIGDFFILIYNVRFDQLDKLEELIKSSISKFENDPNDQLFAITAWATMVKRTTLKDESLLSIIDMLFFAARNGTDLYLCRTALNIIKNNILPTQLGVIIEKLLPLLLDYPDLFLSFFNKDYLPLFLDQIETNDFKIIETIFLSRRDEIDYGVLWTAIPILQYCTNKKDTLMRIFDIIFNKVMRDPYYMHMEMNNDNEILALLNPLLEKMNIAWLPEVKERLLKQLNSDEAFIDHFKFYAIKALKQITNRINDDHLISIKEALILKVTDKRSKMKSASIEALGTVASRIALTELESIKNFLYAELNSFNQEDDALTPWVTVGSLSQLALRLPSYGAKPIAMLIINQLHESNLQNFYAAVDALKAFAPLADHIKSNEIPVVIATVVIAKVPTPKIYNYSNWPIEIRRTVIHLLASIVEKLKKIDLPLFLKIHDILFYMLLRSDFSNHIKLVDLMEKIDDFLIKKLETRLLEDNVYKRTIINILNQVVERINPESLLKIANHILKSYSCVTFSSKETNFVIQLMVRGVENDIDFSSIFSQTNTSHPSFYFLKTMLTAINLMRAERIENDHKNKPTVPTNN